MLAGNKHNVLVVAYSEKKDQDLIQQQACLQEISQENTNSGSMKSCKDIKHRLKTEVLKLRRHYKIILIDLFCSKLLKDTLNRERGP